jgi:hypothetical protein
MDMFNIFYLIDHEYLLKELCFYSSSWNIYYGEFPIVHGNGGESGMDN